VGHRDGYAGSGSGEDDEQQPFAQTVILLRLVLYNAWLLANVIMVGRFQILSGPIIQVQILR